MKLRKGHAAWAGKLWILASVFLVPFLSPWELLPWLGLGAMFGIVWKSLPEEPPEPVKPLPYSHLYRDREIPRADEEKPP